MQIAKNMLEEKMASELIEKITELSKEEIEKISYSAKNNEVK